MLDRVEFEESSCGSMYSLVLVVMTTGTGAVCGVALVCLVVMVLLEDITDCLEDYLGLSLLSCLRVSF